MERKREKEALPCIPLKDEPEAAAWYPMVFSAVGCRALINKARVSDTVALKVLLLGGWAELHR